jgi:hypothetical protein
MFPYFVSFTYLFSSSLSLLSYLYTFLYPQFLLTDTCSLKIFTSFLPLYFYRLTLFYPYFLHSFQPFTVVN